MHDKIIQFIGEIYLIVNNWDKNMRGNTLLFLTFYLLNCSIAVDPSYFASIYAGLFVKFL
jgi:hypothetical protein